MPRNTSLASHPWDCALDPEVSPLFLHLQWAHERSLAVMRPGLRAHGLSAAEFDVLATLRNAPPPHEMTPSQIQHEMVITSGGLTKLMGQLARRGLVERPQSGDDRRIKPVRLSQAGGTLIEAAMQDLLAASGAWLRGTLAAGELAQLSQLLGRLVKAPG